MLTTMWKSAHFHVRANFELLSDKLFIPLDFRPVGFRFLHTPIPSVHCNFLTIILPIKGAHRAYQVPLIIDTNELSALLYSDGYMGHPTVGLKDNLSYPQYKPISHFGLFTHYENYKGSTTVYTFSFFP